jgi:hypothetical protein
MEQKVTVSAISAISAIRVFWHYGTKTQCQVPYVLYMALALKCRTRGVL